MRHFYLISGGTFIDIAPHLSLSARAFGTIGRALLPLLQNAAMALGHEDVAIHLLLTRMALGGNERTQEEQELLFTAGIRDLVTNEDVEHLVDHLITLPDTRGIILTAAMTDFMPNSLIINGEETTEIGMERKRLDSSESLSVRLGAAPKLVSRIRQDRKDIFLVACKTTTGATPDEQYLKGLSLVKRASCNLVLANDLHTHLNMIVTPEQARYHETMDRTEALRGLAEMIILRSDLHFTRTTLVPGEAVAWGSELIPTSLRQVVDHCIARGAYKPFEGKTVGHFATRGPNGTILTSRRKTDFNHLPEIGLVQIEPVGKERIVAHGFKPSVGGQSQRIIFTEHPEVDCIVHMHCPLLPGSEIPIRSQRPYECGSHECGQNTSDGLGSFGTIKAVMLDQHGPNIVFPRNTDPAEVIHFIEANVNLRGRTDGLAA